MRCDEVQSRFSDYLDESAEGPRSKGIENHLTNCPICSEEFAGLLQCRQLVSGLHEVEPPVGFTMRVMANVAEMANETSLWKRLLKPLRISIPLQATAVVLVGILSFYVYQKADYKGMPEPLLPQNLTREQPVVPPASQAKTSDARPVEKTIAQPTREPKTATAERAAPRSRPSPVQAVTDKPSGGDAGTRRSLPIPVQGVVAGGGLAGPIRVPRQAPFRLLPTERELVNLGEPVADYELLVRAATRRSQQSEGIANTSEGSHRPENLSGAAHGGRLIDVDRSSVVNILWFTVPQDQYDQFKNELAAQARIESEVPIGVRDRSFSFRSDGPLFIKVVVLAPTE